jgi:hypothetical protein
MRFNTAPTAQLSGLYIEFFPGTEDTEGLPAGGP